MTMKRKPQTLSIQPKQKRQAQVSANRHSAKNPDDYPCPVCGEKDFTWGRVAGAQFYTKSNVLGVLDGQALRARVCQNCSNVLTFLEMD